MAISDPLYLRSIFKDVVDIVFNTSPPAAPAIPNVSKSERMQERAWRDAVGGQTPAGVPRMYWRDDVGVFTSPDEGATMLPVSAPEFRDAVQGAMVDVVYSGSMAMNQGERQRLLRAGGYAVGNGDAGLVQYYDRAMQTFGRYDWDNGTVEYRPPPSPAPVLPGVAIHAVDMDEARTPSAPAADAPRILDL